MSKLRKILIIIYEDLVLFAKRKKFIFTVMTICLSLTALLSVYMFSYEAFVKRRKDNSYSYKFKTYSINFDENESLVEKQAFCKTLLSNLKYPSTQEFYIEFEPVDKLKVRGMYGDSELFYKIWLIVGRFFSKGELTNGENSIIICDDMLDYSKKLSYLDSIFTLNGEKYRIIGTTLSPHNTLIIPMKKYLSNNYDIHRSEIIFSQILTQKEETAFLQEFKEIFPLSHITIPPDSNPTTNIKFTIGLVANTIFFLMAFVNIISMLKYWIIINKKKYYLFRLSGADQKTVYSIIMLESFILGVLTFFAGALSYFSLIPILERLEIYYMPTFYDILLVFAIFIVCFIIYTHFTANRMSKVEAIYNASEGA